MTRALPEGLQCGVNSPKKRSNDGCIIGFECKQTVEGCRLDIHGRVQLVEIV
jgi:hypothetical protein